MLFRAFLRGRHAAVLVIAGLGVGVGLLEGSFILLAKAYSGSVAPAFTGRPPPAHPLLMLFLIATLRTLAQMGAARLELRAVFAWIGAEREELLRLAAGRAAPAHRAPLRDSLVAALGEGGQRIGDGVIAGCRCLAALGQALVLIPLLFLFSWRLALAALALAVPALLAGRFRAGTLGEAGRKWSASRAGLDQEMAGFAEGMETYAGNGRLADGTEALAAACSRHDGRTRAWETAKAVFPPALEWFFFMALAALAALAISAATGSGAGLEPAAALPFAFLLLLLYRPIREGARNFPVYMLGGQAWRGILALRAGLAAFPPRRPPAQAPGGAIVLSGIRFAYASAPHGGGAAQRDGGERPVFDALDLELECGELTWIAGRNGSGKSTLLKLLAGIEWPGEGRLLLPARLREGSRPFAYLPQRAFLEPDYLEWARIFRRARPGDWEILEGILGVQTLLGAADATAAHAAKGWSGGERQRLCLARVFAAESPFLLLDEPTTWLASGDRERIMGDLLAFWRKDDARRGAALVSHEPFVGEFCSRTVRLDQDRPWRSEAKPGAPESGRRI